MRNVILASVLMLVACGGQVANTEPTPEAKESNPPPMSSTNTPATPVTPATPATTVASAASVRGFRLSDDVLGGAWRNPDDTCTVDSHRFDVDLEAGTLILWTCTGTPAAMTAGATQTLSADENAAITKAYDALVETPPPADCAYDGHQLTLTAGGKTFMDEDMNCKHRTDVTWVSSLYELTQTTAAIAGVSFTPAG